jgi:hypothetical protein
MTQPPSVTFRVAHFISVDCGQRVQNFCFRLCASHGAARGTRFRPTISGQDGLTSLDRLAAIHLFLVPHFLLLFLLLLSLYLFSATGDVTAMCFLTFTFVTCRDIIFFLSKLHLFCLSLLSSRPCEDQRLPPDATNARTYRHFTENHLKFSPLAKTEKGKTNRRHNSSFDKSERTSSTAEVPSFDALCIRKSKCLIAKGNKCRSSRAAQN